MYNKKISAKGKLVLIAFAFAIFAIQIFASRTSASKVPRAVQKFNKLAKQYLQPNADLYKKLAAFSDSDLTKGVGLEDIFLKQALKIFVSSGIANQTYKVFKLDKAKRKHTISLSYNRKAVLQAVKHAEEGLVEDLGRICNSTEADLLSLFTIAETRLDNGQYFEKISTKVKPALKKYCEARFNVEAMGFSGKATSLSTLFGIPLAIFTCSSAKGPEQNQAVKELGLFTAVGALIGGVSSEVASLAMGKGMNWKQEGWLRYDALTFDNEHATAIVNGGLLGASIGLTAFSGYRAASKKKGRNYFWLKCAAGVVVSLSVVALFFIDNIMDFLDLEEEEEEEEME